jgi:hypothetical protein
MVVYAYLNATLMITKLISSVVRILAFEVQKMIFYN